MLAPFSGGLPLYLLLRLNIIERLEGVTFHLQRMQPYVEYEMGVT